MASNQSHKESKGSAVEPSGEPTERVFRCNRIVATKLGFSPAELEGREYVDIPFSEFVARADAADIPVNVVDHALIYQYVNPVLAGIFGYEDPQEIVGQSALFNVTMAEAEPANMIETIHDTGLQSDKMILRPDGEVRKLSGSYIAIRDEGDMPMEFAGFDEDQTERKQREELFEKLAEFTYEWIIWLSPEGRITYASPSSERITGYSSAEWTSGAVGWKELVEPSDIGRVREGVYGSLQRQETGLAEFRIRTKAGETLWVEMASIPVFGARSEFQGARISVRDVTERRYLQEKLLRAERLAAVGEAAGSISHELRSPLSVIKSSTFFLDEKLAVRDEKVTKHLERIGRSVERAERTINDLLAFSRMTPLQLIPISLAALVQGTVTEMRLPPEMQVRMEADEDAPFALIDPAQMELVLRNLLLNSFQAMPGGGEVEVCIKRDGEGLVLSVRDAGCGIASEDISRVFEPLYSTKAEGTGFGLAVCRRIVEEHGGSISLESAPGKGTTVSINLRAAA